MDEEDLSWLALGALVAYLLLKKPCPCEGTKANTIAPGEPSPMSSSSGNCPGGLFCG